MIEVGGVVIQGHGINSYPCTDCEGKLYYHTKDVQENDEELEEIYYVHLGGGVHMVSGIKARDGGYKCDKCTDKFNQARRERRENGGG